MSDEVKLDDDLDLDSLLDELDDMVSPESAPPKELNSREVITNLGKGALDSVANNEAAAGITKTMIDRALPKGFKVTKDALDDAVSDAITLYDRAIKPVKKPLNELKREINRRVDSATFLGEKARERIKKWTTVEETKTEKAVDPRRLEIDLALKEIFSQMPSPVGTKEFTDEASTIKRDIAFKDVSRSLLESSSKSLSRISGFNENIVYRYQQKALELQFLHYGLAKDSLDAFRAYAADTDRSLKSVIHNTALPDFQKIKLSEGYQSAAVQNLYGRVNETLGEFTTNFSNKLMKTLTGRAESLGGSIGDTISGLASQASTMDMVGELDTASRYQMVGGLGGSLIADKLTNVVSKKLKKYLSRDSRLGRQSDELLYIFENYPSYFNKVLKDWDGSVLPEEVIKKFPSLSSVNAGALKGFIRELLPQLSNQDITLTSPDMGALTQPSVFDVGTRQSIVEVIPALLVRNNQLLEQIYTGGEAEKETYSYKKRGLVRESEAAADFKEEALANVSRRRERMGDAAIKLVTTGTGIRLDDQEKKDLKRVLTETAIKGEVFNLSDLQQKDYGKSTDKIRELLSNQTGNLSRKNRVGATILREMAGGQKDIQEMVNRYSAAGKVDVLRNAGIVENKYGRASIRQEAITDAGNIKDLVRNAETSSSGIIFDRNKPAEPASGRRNDGETLNQLTDVLREMTEVFRSGPATKTHTGYNYDSALQPNAIKIDYGSAPAGTSYNARTGRVEPKETFDYNGIYNTFFRNYEEGEAIPVRLLQRNDAGGLSGDQDPWKQTILDVINTGFADEHSYLDNILGAILRSGGTEGGPAGEGNLPKSSRWKGYLKAALKSPIDVAKWQIGAGNKIVGSALGVVGKLGKGIGSHFKNDIFVGGNQNPVLRSEVLKAGGYVDEATGKVLKSIKDITGNVKDAAGNIVLTKEEIEEKGIYSSGGIDLSGLVGKLTSPIKHAFNFNSMVTSGLSSIPMGAYRLVKKYNEQIRDIYVPGEKTPRLYAHVLKTGGYFSQVTNKPIRTYKDIDGPVIDESGNVLLSAEDLKRGLVDSRGNPIELPALASFIKDYLSKGTNIVKSLISSSINMGNKILSAPADLISGIYNKVARPDITVDKMGDDEDVLAEILEYMKIRWPLNEKKSSDSNDDGVRDNSIADILARRKAAKEKKDDGEPEGENGGKTTEKTSTGFGFIGSIFTGVTAKIGTLIDIVKGIGTTIASWFAFSKLRAAEDAASDLGGDGIDTDRRRKSTRRRGRGGKGFGKITRMAKKAIPWVTRNAGKALKFGVRAAPAALSFIGRKALVAGAGVVAGIVGMPYVAGAIAAAGVAYTGYQVYKYFTNRRDPKDLEKLRILQYGFSVDDMDSIVLLRALEKKVLDKITYQDNRPRFSLTIAEAAQEFAEDFGISLSNAGQIQEWSIWFARRFFPIFMTHLSAARGIDKGIDINDIDDELAKDKIPDFARSVTFKANFPAGNNPYAVTSSPIVGKAILSNVEAINTLANNLINQNEKGPKATIIKETTPKVEAEAMAQEVKARQGSKTQASQGYVKASDNRSKYINSSTQREANKSRPIINIPKIGPMKPETKDLKLIMPAEGEITSPYGMRVHPISGTRKMHKGVDIANAEGTPIMASADGVIYRLYRSKSYGNVIYIKHANGMSSRYAHMSRFSDVKLGDKVTQGQVIGYMGNTGRSAGVHLHWEVRKTTAQDASSTNPLDFVGRQTVKSLDDKEKMLVEAEKDADKMPADENLEGRDTIQSTLFPDAVVPKRNRKSAGAVSDDKKESATSETTKAAVKAFHSARKAQEASSKELAKMMDSQGNAMEAAYTQRETMITNQRLMVESLKVISDTLMAISEGQVSLIDITSSSRNVKQSRTKSRELRPVVKMN